MNRKFLGLLALGMVAVGISMASNNAEAGLCDWLFGHHDRCDVCAPECDHYCAPACGHASHCDFDDDDWACMPHGGHAMCHPVCHPVCHPIRHYGHGRSVCHPVCHPVRTYHHAPVHHAPVHHAPAHHVDCCSPAPTCCAPAPTCCAPAPSCCH